MSEIIYPQLEIFRKVRMLVFNTIKDLTAQQLNTVPKGYNNNIIWNVAHIIAAQEGICYLKAGQQLSISEQFYHSYKPGSKPETDLDENQIAQIKELLFTSIDQLESDLQQNKFDNYTGWTTRYGVEMNSINDALNFLPFHEGMHLGYIMALKRNEELCSLSS